MFSCSNTLSNIQTLCRNYKVLKLRRLLMRVWNVRVGQIGDIMLGSLILKWIHTRLK